MWVLVSVSVLTCAVVVACLGPRKKEVHMGGIEFSRPHVMAVQMVEDMEQASLRLFHQVIGRCQGDLCPQPPSGRLGKGRTMNR